MAGLAAFGFTVLIDRLGAIPSIPDLNLKNPLAL
jgi:hypothetical protein